MMMLHDPHSQPRLNGSDVVVPFDIEAEQALLGSLFVNNEHYDQICEIIAPADCYDPLHGRILNAIGQLISQGKVASPLTLKPYFENEPNLGDITVPSYLAKLVGHAALHNVDRLVNPVELAEAISDIAKRRDIILTCQEAIQVAAQPYSDEPASKILEETENRLFAITGRQVSERTSFPLGEIADHAIDKIVEGDQSDLVPTGLTDLDRPLGGGYQKGELGIVAGRPSMGKTAFGSSVMLTQGRAGYGIIYFSLEMTGASVAHRCFSDLIFNQQTPIPYSRMRNMDVKSYEVERLRDAAKRFHALDITIDDKRGLSPVQIASRSRQIAREYDKAGRTLDIIYIDHLGLLAPGSRYKGNKVYEIAETVDALATLAKDLNVAVVGLHQLNRQVESRDDKRPMLADLRDSGALEEHAATVIFLYRAAYYLERAKYDAGSNKETARLEQLAKHQNTLEIIVAKQRNGECRTITASAFMACNAIRDRAHGGSS